MRQKLRRPPNFAYMPGDEACLTDQAAAPMSWASKERSKQPAPAASPEVKGFVRRIAIELVRRGLATPTPENLFVSTNPIVATRERTQRVETVASREGKPGLSFSDSN